MTTLAPKLPYDHPYAPGYPGYGSQHVPSDPDARDYLARVAAADGAGVEVGIANAIEQFILGCKADSTWDAIQASCILCGARTLSGALVPLKGGPLSGAAELYDASTVPAIINLDGSVGSWNASTNTFSNTNSSGSSTRPAFRFSFPGLVAGGSYYISGRFSGDVGSVTALDLHNNPSAGNAGTLSYDQSTGEFSGTSYNAFAGFLQIDTDGTTGPFSVTIEELSIKEAMPPPTPYNFVEADYNRSGTPGLKGDGATKYLDANRLSDADPQDDAHLAVYATEVSTTANTAYAGEATNTRLLYENNPLFYGRANAASYTTISGGNVAGFLGASRVDSANQSIRANKTTNTQAVASIAPTAQRLTVFSRLTGLYSPSRLAFYSFGAGLDLAALDDRVTNMVNGIKFYTLTGLVASDYDPATVAYIVASYEAGGVL